MAGTRPAAVAGVFYTENTAQLESEIAAMLGSAARASGACPRMLVVPHAGYIYSGKIAATAYHELQGRADHIRRVVLIGPNHRVPLRGIALPTAEFFDTPLGPIPLDTEALNDIAHFPVAEWNDLVHAREHCLEVQLPFLRQALGAFRLVPLVVGECAPERVAEVLEKLWREEDTLFVVSTDLSHYHPYREAQAIDADSAMLIEGRQPTLRPDQACGAHALNGALLVAKNHDLSIRRLSLLNSGDTAGSRDQVVGYGAWALFSPSAEQSEGNTCDESQQLKHAALSLAKDSLRRAVNHLPPPRASDAPAALQTTGACFVTLHRHGQLRGCIGSVEAHRSLAQDIIDNAAASALQDHRFMPVQPHELPEIELEVSLLSTPEELPVTSFEALAATLRPGVDGLILREGRQRATYLPAVWSQLPEAEDFISSLLRKGGWPPHYWSPDMRAWRYTVEKC